jgi:two-component system cell cycle sensor histidine kinase/response regulator CckA
MPKKTKKNPEKPVSNSDKNITEKQRARKAVEVFQKMNQDILSHSPFGVMVVNRIGQIEYVNPVMVDITGETFDQIKKTNIFEAAHFSNCGLSDYMENIFLRGESFIMSYVSIVSPSGKNFVVNIYGMILKERTTVKALLFFEDLSEIRRADEIIKVKDKAMDSSINAIIMSDLDGNINYVNKTFLTMWGYTGLRDVVERPLKDFFFNNEELKNILESVHSGNAWVGEINACRKDLTQFDAWVSANMVKDDSGNPAYLMASFVDISEKKKIESQLLQAQKMETIGRLAGGVAHDFNNLLTAIINYATLAKYRIKREDPVYDDLEQIMKVSDRAANLTRQLLSFSRRQIISLKPVDINEFMINIDKMLRRLIPENIELVVNLCPQRVHISADIGQMEQVLVNLVVNSRDAMPHGGKIVIFVEQLKLKDKYISTHCEVGPGEYVFITITDNGTGMDDEVKKHLFEPFFTTKDVGKGTGLGLSTVYGIVKQHHGHVDIISKVNEGTQIKMYLPWLAQQATTTTDIKSDLVELPKGHEDIFVVEDEPTVRDITVKLLQILGYKVTAAIDGVNALNLAQNHTGPLAALVTDVVMPNMSGKDLAMKFKVIYPGIKILFVSGYTNDPTVFSDLGPGTAFLQKPFTDVLLANKLRELLDR